MINLYQLSNSNNPNRTRVCEHLRADECNGYQLINLDVNPHKQVSKKEILIINLYMIIL